MGESGGPLTGTQHAFDFLKLDSPRIPATNATFGDEALLKRLVRKKLRAEIVGEDGTSLETVYAGETVEWRDVADELATISLFGGSHRRLVIVENAPDFVTKFRKQLEKYVAQPRRSSVLLLEVGTWPASTNLYKSIQEVGLQVDCRLPQKEAGRGTKLDEGRLFQWLAEWAKSRHDAVLVPSAARLLWDLAGPDLGCVDQELAKLALFSGTNGKIDPKLVQDVTGGWRGKNIWDIVDAAANGDAAEALRHLDRALTSEAHPLGLFGQIAWSLRRYAAATRMYQRAVRRGERTTLQHAIAGAGFGGFPQAVAAAEGRLRQIGSERAGQLLRWLVDADLALKGTHSGDERARFVLEQLFLRLARRTGTDRRGSNTQTQSTRTSTKVQKTTRE